jgi:hypothetical protein
MPVGAFPQRRKAMKKFKIFFTLLIALACLVSISAMAISAEETGEAEKTITVSFIQSQDTTDTTTTLDKTAHADGKITVKAGEKFTLPTTANNSYLGQDGYVLVWYTENGRTYKAGEEVSFDKDTKLFRCAAKEVSTIDELNTAMTNNSTCAILVADIDATKVISVKNQGQSVLILNGHTINIAYTNKNSNGYAMGDQRS